MADQPFIVSVDHDGRETHHYPDRNFWRYLLAGLALISYSPTMVIPEGAAAAAVRDADVLLAELEKRNA